MLLYGNLARDLWKRFMRYSTMFMLCHSLNIVLVFWLKQSLKTICIHSWFRKFWKINWNKFEKTENTAYKSAITHLITTLIMLINRAVRSTRCQVASEARILKTHQLIIPPAHLRLFHLNNKDLTADAAEKRRIDTELGFWYDEWRCVSDQLIV